MIQIFYGLVVLQREEIAGVGLSDATNLQQTEFCSLQAVLNGDIRGFAVLGAVDKAFQEGSFEILSDEGLNCGALVVWWKSVRLCLADEVFLVPLADSFVRLLLQLVSRLSSWVTKGVEADSEKRKYTIEVLYTQRNAFS